MNLNEKAQTILNLAKDKGADQFDFSIVETESTDVEVFQAQIKKSEISSEVAASLRVIKNNRVGYASSKKLEGDSLKLLVEDALQNSEIGADIDIDLPKKIEAPNLDLKSFEQSLESISMQDMIEFCMDVEKGVLEKDLIINVPYLGLGKSSSHKHFYNSNGHTYRIKGNHLSGFVGAVAEKDGIKKTGMYGKGGRKFSVLDKSTFIKTSVERAVELLDAKPIASGNYDIVFSNQVTSRLLGMFLSTFSAEMIQKKLSKFMDKIDTQIASSCISLKCLPHLVGAPGSKIFDAEGVLCKDTDVIENGVLKTFLYNSETAKKENRVSTGHASGSLGSRLGVSFSNAHFSLGKDNLDALLQTPSKCLYVVKLEGGSACNVTSGEISLGIQGFYYEKGKRIQAVDRMVMKSNFFELLHQVEACSDSYDDTFSGYKVPDLLIKNIQVSG